MNDKTKIFLVLGAFLVIVLSAFTPILSQTANAIVCRFEATACVESWGSNIVVYPGQPNATMTPAFRVVATSGAMYRNGIACIEKSATITDSASYTATAIAPVNTPTWASCTLNSITGDSARCAATTGSGIVTITVKNSAATPAANSSGAALYFRVCGN